MNFIEAHEIFYDYCGALSKGNFYNTELPCGGDVEKNKHCFHYCYFSLLDIEYTDFDTHSFFTMQMMREMKKEFDD